VREEIYEWRNKGYPGASPTSTALLRWWFETDHLIDNADGSRSTFRYYFAQREAVETVIWLHEVRRARDKFDLMRFTSLTEISPQLFVEDWPRYVLKMATGAGKTKVLSLLIAWCFFHKLYEPDSPLARNFLVIAPNIIVLDRLRADFDGLKIFFNDPVFPDNGYEGRNWRDDFQVTLHIQDDVCIIRETGNFFLTNIHRVFLGDVRDPSLEDDDLRDYFLAPFGAKPAGKTTDSKTDLGEIVREISEPDAGKILYDSFKTAINALTIEEAGTTRIEDRIRLREMRPFRTEHRPYLEAGKSIFTKIVGEPHSGGFELSFAAFLEAAGDVAAFAKNYLPVGFKLDYVKANGDLANYTPDFIVRTTDGLVWIVETKGRAELDLPQKMARLKQWCADATAAEENGQRYDFVFVDQTGFEKHGPKTFASLTACFTEYRVLASMPAPQ
jgi:hypothetical protein